MESNSHDRIQQECWMYLWNTHPQTRGTCWHNMNEFKPYPGENKKAFYMRINRAKSIGILPGVWDLLWYWSGVLYIFDIKREESGDRLSDDQKRFRDAILKQGGKELVVADLNEFINFVKKIL